METVTEKNSLVSNIAKSISTEPKYFDAVQLKKFVSQIETLGLPTRRHEEYKYSPPEKHIKNLDLTAIPDATVTENAIAQRSFNIFNAYHVIVVNGIVNEELSSLADTDNFVISTLEYAFEKHRKVFETHFDKEAKETTDTLALINKLSQSNGLFIYVKKGKTISKPVSIININTGAKNVLINQRNLIVAEENSQLDIVEQFISISSDVEIFNNTLTEVFVGASANVSIEQLQNRNNKHSDLNNTFIIQEKNSVLNTGSYTFNGAYTRNNLTVNLDGEYIESHLNGLQFGTGNQLIDNHTNIIHAKPNCNSNELYKAVLKDESTVVFNGKIFVKQDAQKTNAYQSSKNILLSDNATVYTKPQLEIFADDVKCSHGTTTGQMDETALFYLQARGIGREMAKVLLTQAFADDVLDKIKNEDLKNYIHNLLALKLK